jgi:hypothetical protein
MLEQRFRHLLAKAPVPTLGGFTACPSSVAQWWSAAQQTWVGQLYRIAHERTQAELHTLPRYHRLLTISMN